MKNQLDEIKEIMSRLRLFQNGTLWTIDAGLASSLGGIIGDMERAIRAVEAEASDSTAAA